MSGPGPLPRSGPAPAVALGLATATLVGTAIGVPATVGVGVGVLDGGALALGDGLGDGLGLGLAVGGAVGGGVGGSVGRGVDGAGVAVGPSTTIVPFIVVWIEQWYAKLPATANDTVFAPFAAIAPVSNAPVSDVAVWLNPSVLSQVMLSPTLIVAVCGRNVKFWMTTLWLVASAAPGTRAPIAITSAATRNGLLRRIR